MLAPGSRIDDRYEIIDALGAGGMGAVYRARRVHLGDEVAIKVMQPAPNAPPELRDRFLRESRACAQLRHPNIVGLLDFGFDSANQPYMVMELLSGPSLREELDLEAPMDPARVVAVLDDVGAALQLAHDRGITHRDLKPANIVAHRYESGERVYKVIDFGLAAIKAANDETRLTQPALFLGTLAYAAPEQLRGDDVSPATDVYALGVIAYEMLTGGRPVEDANQATMIQQRLTGDPVAPTTRRPSLRPAIEAAVLKALARDPAGRWPCVKAFIEALHSAIGDASSSVAPAADSGLLSRYELGPLLGRGRLGSSIHQGLHRTLGVPVAIRVLKRSEQPHWEAVRARFLLEGRTLQIAHPGLLLVRDLGEDDRAVYLVTDFVEGPSLREAMAASGAFEWPRALSLLRQAADAVGVLNARGGFISGINPDMIRLRETSDSSGRPAEQIVMSSPGIRSVQDVLATMREQELRGQEASSNELPYLAPEVMMGGEPNAIADVFTIGVLAYQMVTATLPFTAPSLPELLGQMLQMKAKRPLQVSDTAAAAILKAIDSAPANRFESAAAFVGALA